MGKIILLNTPIGNLADITKRVEQSLREGEIFAVEDTRVFKELLNHLGISVSGKKIFSLHDQSESGQIDKLLEFAERGDLYVASDAGSPIISDPAYPLVVAAYQKGLVVDSFSGISSPIMALELAGLPPLPFQFHGFLPREKQKRQKIFQDCSLGTHIFFEAPTRIVDTMMDLNMTLPSVDVVIVRELSKKFQEVLRFKAQDWPQIQEKLNVKGEFVLLFHVSEKSKLAGGKLVELASEVLEQGGTPKTLAKLLAEILDRPTKDIYTEISRFKK